MGRFRLATCTLLAVAALALLSRPNYAVSSTVSLHAEPDTRQQSQEWYADLVNAPAQRAGRVVKTAALPDYKYSLGPFDLGPFEDWLRRTSSISAASSLSTLTTPPPSYRCGVFVSHRHRVIFIRNRKSASTSVITALNAAMNTDKSCLQGACLKRASPEDLKRYSKGSAAALWRNYTVISTVRNPWARAASGYDYTFSFWSRKTPGCTKPSFLEFTRDPMIMGRVSNLFNCAPNRQTSRGNGDQWQHDFYHIEPAFHCMSDQGRPVVDFLVRYELLQEDLREAMLLINERLPPRDHLPIPEAVPWRKRGSTFKAKVQERHKQRQERRQKQQAAQQQELRDIEQMVSATAGAGATGEGESPQQQQQQEASERRLLGDAPVLHQQDLPVPHHQEQQQQHAAVTSVTTVTAANPTTSRLLDSKALAATAAAVRASRSIRSIRSLGGHRKAMQDSTTTSTAAAVRPISRLDGMIMAAGQQVGMYSEDGGSGGGGAAGGAHLALQARGVFSGGAASSTASASIRSALADEADGNKATAGDVQDDSSAGSSSSTPMEGESTAGSDSSDSSDAADTSESDSEDMLSHIGKYRACGEECVRNIAQFFAEDLRLFGFSIPAKPAAGDNGHGPSDGA